MPEWMFLILQIVVIGGIIIFAIVMWWRRNFSLKNYESKSSASASSSTSKGKEEPYFIVRDSYCMERILRFTDFQGRQPRTDWNEKSPFYRKDYLYLIDDIGNYWRSYDGCKTFIEEKDGEIVR